MHSSFMYFTLCAQDVGGVKFAKLFMLAPGTFSFVSKEWWLYASGSYCRVPSNQSHHGRRPAILPPLERLPDQHGRLLQTSQRREKLLWCDDRNWGKQTFVKFGIGCTMSTVQGQHTKAHKMILCACSPYFKNLLEQNPAKHPIIILKVCKFSNN